MTPQEFNTNVLPLRDKIYRFAAQILKDREAARDVVQDTFLKIWTRKDNLGEIRNLEAFAMVVAKNYSYDQIRSEKMRREKSEMIKEAQIDQVDYQKLEQVEAVNRVKMIIETLPETQRLVIHLRDIEEYDFKEISEVMGIKEDAVRVNLSRARKKIRDTMIKIYNYEYKGS
jgi:RNA polymerase sigma-70 factor (ECF subfamily)